MFLNPLLLFGLSAVSVPIIIHILNRRKFQRVVWAAMRFVRIAMEKNQRRIQWEDIILLILRCVLVALLAFALARPMLSGGHSLAGLASKVTAVVMIDNSYSMSQIDAQTSKFEQAKRIADQVVGDLPSGSNVSVLLASDVGAPVIPLPTYDLLYARDAIRKAAIGDRSSNMVAPLRRALEILKSQQSPRKEIYLITDTQALGWRQTGDIQKLLDDSRKEVTTHLIFVGQQSALNLGVSDLRMAGAIATTNRPLRFEVQVANYGLTEVRNIPVKIAVDSDPPSEETVIDSIPGGGSKNVSLYARFKFEGLHTVTARLPVDVQPADDTRTIVVRVIKQAQVLVVDGGGLPTTPREDMESRSYFVREALQPVPPDMRDQFYVQVKTVGRNAGGGAALAQSNLDAFDAVILANVPDLPASDTAALERFVKNGGGLLVFPGPDAKPQWYIDQLFKRDHLLPASLEAPRGDADQAEKFWTLQAKGYEHPIVTLWNDPAAGSLTSAKFFKVADLAVPADAPEASKTDAGSSRIVARYNDGKATSDGNPAIVEHTFGLGRVIMLGVGSDTAWSDLPVRPKVFIPLLHRMLGSLLSRQDDYLNVKVGQKFVLRTQAEMVNKDALITRRSESTSAKPISDTRRVGLVDDKAVLLFENTDVAGAYDVQVAGDAFRWKFAALRDPEESRLEALTQSQFDQLGGVARVVHWKGGADNKITAELRQDGVGTELWFPLSVLVLVLAVSESWLAHWFSRSK